MEFDMSAAITVPHVAVEPNAETRVNRSDPISSADDHAGAGSVAASPSAAAPKLPSERSHLDGPDPGDYAD
jgi:hypothetical protein